MDNLFICSHYPPEGPHAVATLMAANQVRFRISACRKSGGTLAVGPWSPPPQHIRITAPLRAELRLPRVAVIVRDGTLKYALRLTNLGARPFRFPTGSCPDYSLWISGSGSYSETLDCHAMRSLPPGKTAVFRLQEDWAIMDEVLPGRHRIGWQLHGARPGSGASGALEIKYRRPTRA
jgi:hypothetical protein